MNVTVYRDYTADQQQVLLSSLEAAAVAVSATSQGRGEETVSEGFAAAEYILGSQPDHVDSPLITSVLVELQARVKDGWTFPDFVAVSTAPDARASALETLRAVATLLDATVTADEAAHYKGWLLAIAEVTAGAGKEDQGFLGRGGVMVNDTERVALGEIAVDPRHRGVVHRPRRRRSGRLCSGTCDGDPSWHPSPSRS